MDKKAFNPQKFVLISILFLALGIFIGLEMKASEAELETVEVDSVEKEAVEDYMPRESYEESVVEVVNEAIKGAVSIKVEDDWTSGGGSGFFVSSDGIILTNRHVVQSERADYEVVTYRGERLEAEVIARDPAQDLAFLEVEGEDFHVNPFGDSDDLKLGQTAIAIGYTLGEFENSVSVGVVSGLGRDIWAGDGRQLEYLSDVIQTDAAINLGNSGGPLLNLRGEVIGINTAKEVGAENVGFAIPISKARGAIESVLERGEVVHPYIGIRYVTIDETESRLRGLPIDYGALIVRGGRGQPAIDPDSPAAEVDLREGDIITHLDGEKIDKDKPLFDVILDYSPGETIEIEYIRGEETHTVELELAERTSD